MRAARRIAGVLALGLYLWMGALMALVILPGVSWIWPPDFNHLPYDAGDMAPFAEALLGAARDAYGRLLTRLDPAFILCFSGFLALMGWRGGRLRYVIAAVAAVYGAVDLAEDAALYAAVFDPLSNTEAAGLAGWLSPAKFALIYGCVGLILWNMRLERAGKGRG